MQLGKYTATMKIQFHEKFEMVKLTDIRQGDVFEIFTLVLEQVPKFQKRTYNQCILPITKY